MKAGSCDLGHGNRPLHLKSLPTDPDLMDDWLRKRASGVWVQLMDGAPPVVFEGDQSAFETVGYLMVRGIVPPAQAAALYRAAARHSGVRTDEDAVDVLGRHGVGIVREDAKLPFRTEWIFDRTTHQMLGQRATFTRDFGKYKKGTVFDDDAVVRRAVVDKAGLRP
ncbi:CU044_5270 family protein [Streptomyces sp. NPDC060000]|uniref:CU044_5270 family protein n=1 Tax=Streptomyces sp. NPDC060000 TaxID=3347031 RepID=UPI0036C1D796